MERLVSKPRNSSLIAFADPTEAGVKSFRNLGNVKTVSVRDLNPLTVLGSTYIVFENPEAAVAILETRMGGKKMSAPTAEKSVAKPKITKAAKLARPRKVTK